MRRREERGKNRAQPGPRPLAPCSLLCSRHFDDLVSLDLIAGLEIVEILQRQTALEARTDFPYGVGYQRLRSMRNRAVLDRMLKKP